MNAVDVIAAKRDGRELTREEIRFFVEGFAAGAIPDYQAAAWAMAVTWRGMTQAEITHLTMALVESGEMLDLSGVLPFALDKHSSGGVGDKTTLVVLPLVVACGVPVAKMSGRGLSLTGGTLDKMESITGFTTDLSQEQFLAQAGTHGIVLAGQTADLVPADGKLYAIRDVTGTVPSKPLIASSIMSKKIAGGADGIVLDVKVGRGAFMPTVADARELAEIMVRIGRSAGRRVTALISDMNQPLGRAVGNALEVREAIDTLRGDGPPDLVEHSLTVAGHMLRLAGRSKLDDLSDVRSELEGRLASGQALEVFQRLVAAQGGDVSQVDDPDRLPRAPVVVEQPAQRSGYLAEVDAQEIGLAVLHLGAGRLRKGDPVDHAVGAVIHHKVGEHVERDELLFTVHARTPEAAEDARRRILDAHMWADRPGLPLLHDVLLSD
jgi:pyrimidine-nucleoside phosphorylase